MEQRAQSWDLLRTLHNQYSTPWIIEGDFNEVLHNSEKTGGRDRVNLQMDAFQQALSDCVLTDVGYRGSPYTWTSKRMGQHNVRCRLDRICANDLGLQLFPDPIVRHLPLVGSDHCPLLLSLHGPEPARRSRGVRPFKFESFWVTKDKCRKMYSLGIREEAPLIWSRGWSEGGDVVVN